MAFFIFLHLATLIEKVSALRLERVSLNSTATSLGRNPKAQTNPSVVNFINILHAHFLCKSALRIFSLVMFWLYNFLAQKVRIKCWRKWEEKRALRLATCSRGREGCLSWLSPLSKTGFLCAKFVRKKMNSQSSETKLWLAKCSYCLDFSN